MADSVPVGGPCGGEMGRIDGFQPNTNIEVGTDVLQRARTLSQGYAEGLANLYDEVRREHRAKLAELRDVESRLLAWNDDREPIRDSIGEGGPAHSYAPGGPSTSSTKQTCGTTTNASALSSSRRRVAEDRESIRLLVEEQARLAQELVLLAGAGRKVQAVTLQAELATRYLTGNGEDGGGTADLGELTQMQVLRAHEDERRRLARDVHDGPAQVLVNAIFELQVCKRLLDQQSSKARDQLDNLESDLRDGLSEVRQFIYDLHPVSLAELGLIATLRRYLAGFTDRSSIQARLRLGYDFEPLPETIELGIFRFVQEALQNVRKHSQASQVTVTLLRHDDQIDVIVEDNGVGFDPNGVGTNTKRRAYGLLGMRERALLLHGSVKIDSTPGRGTRLELLLPVSPYTPSDHG